MCKPILFTVKSITLIVSPQSLLLVLFPALDTGYRNFQRLIADGVVVGVRGLLFRLDFSDVDHSLEPASGKGEDDREALDSASRNENIAVVPVVVEVQDLFALLLYILLLRALTFTQKYLELKPQVSVVIVAGRAPDNLRTATFKPIVLYALLIIAMASAARLMAALFQI